MIYYQDDYVTLYLGDCLEQTAWLEAEVLVTDPPYGMAYNSGWSKEHNGIANDKDTVIRDAVLEIWDNKPGLVFGTWRVERPANTRNVLIWDKGDDPFMGDLSLPWGTSFEEIYVIGKGFIGSRVSSVIRANTLPKANRPNHPTPKPTGLMQRLIEKTVGTIADPFAGSGATLVAAKNLGRKAIGVELEEKYCELIAKRLSQDTFDFSKLPVVEKETYTQEALI